MEVKISQSGLSFAKVLRSYQTGGITYSDFLGHVNRYLEAGESPAELMEVLRRRQLIEPLPDFAHDALALLLNEPSPAFTEEPGVAPEPASTSEPEPRAVPTPHAAPVPRAAPTPSAAPTPRAAPPAPSAAPPLSAAPTSSAAPTPRAAPPTSAALPPSSAPAPSATPAPTSVAVPDTSNEPEKTVAIPRAGTRFSDASPVRTTPSLTSLAPLTQVTPPVTALDEATPSPQASPLEPPASLQQVRPPTTISPLEPEKTVVIPRAGTPFDGYEPPHRTEPSIEPELPHPTVEAAERTVRIPRGGLIIGEYQPPAMGGVDEVLTNPDPLEPFGALPFGRPRRRSLLWLAAALIAAVIGWVAIRPSSTSHATRPSTGVVTGMVTVAQPPTAGAEPGTTLQDCPTCPRMIVLPPGRFKQGSAYDDHDALPSEKPQHIVLIKRPLAMAVNELTVANFQEFVTDTKRELPGCETYDGEWHHKSGANWQDPGFTQGPDHPVTCVSWNDAVAYAEWLSRKTGHHYRLPSASEWEYAARSGSEAQVPWSPGLLAACDNANVADRSGARRYPKWSVFACKDGYVNTAPVGSFKANTFGLADMLGNVFEWTQDCWSDDYSRAPIDGAARTDGDCGEHELRGGSWFSSPAFVRLAYRNHYATGYRSSSIGVRLVRELAP